MPLNNISRNAKPKSKPRKLPGQTQGRGRCYTVAPKSLMVVSHRFGEAPGIGSVTAVMSLAGRGKEGKKC